MKIVNFFILILFVAFFFQRCQENEKEDIYYLDPEKSILKWQNSTSQNPESGTFDILAHNIKVENGKIKSGTITIAIDKNENKQNATLEIKTVELLSGIYPDAIKEANWWVKGELSISGQRHEIAFPAKISFQGNDIEMEAKFSLDPKKWNVELTEQAPLQNQLSILDFHLKGKGSIKNKVVV